MSLSVGVVARELDEEGVVLDADVRFGVSLEGDHDLGAAVGSAGGVDALDGGIEVACFDGPVVISDGVVCAAQADADLHAAVLPDHLMPRLLGGFDEDASGVAVGLEADPGELVAGGSASRELAAHVLGGVVHAGNAALVDRVDGAIAPGPDRGPRGAEAGPFEREAAAFGRFAVRAFGRAGSALEDRLVGVDACRVSGGGALPGTLAGTVLTLSRPLLEGALVELLALLGCHREWRFEALRRSAGVVQHVRGDVLLGCAFRGEEEQEAGHAGGEAEEAEDGHRRHVGAHGDLPGGRGGAAHVGTHAGAHAPVGTQDRCCGSWTQIPGAAPALTPGTPLC